jgi:acetylornithine deacetylase
MPKTLPDLETLITALVAAPSVSSVQPALDQSNRLVCELLAGWLEDAGLRVSLLPVPDRPGKVNLVARTGEGPGGLVLAGHTDTVPCDPELWEHDPYAVRRREDVITGLGVSDMKGFLALAVEAAARHAGRRLDTPLVILATADEESSMSGARALAADDPGLGARAVIGEPTAMRPVYRHKGVLMEAIRLTGRSGHSSNPALGRNALEGMLAAAAALKRLEADWGQRYPDRSFEVTKPTLNLGYIQGGDNPNRICGRCEMHVDVRLNPGMTVAATRAELRQAVRAGLEGSGLEVEFEALFEGVDPLSGRGGGVLLESCQALSGHAPDTACFGTEGPFLEDLGLETVILGPGRIEVAHQPGECLELAAAARCAEVLDGLIERHCREGQDAGR